jgi:peptidoglycan-associated lipoprotein
MRSSWSVAALIAVALTVAGCGKKKVEVPPAATPTPAAAEPTRPATPPPPPAAPTPTQPAALSEDEIFAKTSLEELNAQKPLADVFFAYDAVDLTEPSRAALQKNLQWLNRWKTTKIMIEGHTDSRGTNEYNLALGERRGDAARDYLVSLGLTADRVTVVSKGEEQPSCSEETESCWQQNRRAHFVITAK